MNRFCKFFETREQLERFKEKTLEPEVYINMVGDPTRIYYNLEAIRMNLPYEMRTTNPFCLTYSGITKIRGRRENGKT